MFTIEYATNAHKDFWFTLDKHISENELNNKIKHKRAYIIFNDHKPAGILRYNLFWDNIPFLTMIYIDEAYQNRGLGRNAIIYWENEMQSLGYKMVMTSTQSDEGAQHFYRKLGYKDSGCLVMDMPHFQQAMEMFFVKGLMNDEG